MTASTWSLIRSDVDRYRYMTATDKTVGQRRPDGPVITIKAILMCQGLQASIVYRIGHGLVCWQPASSIGRLARMACRTAHFVASKIVEATTGISIAERAAIGPGLYIGHFGGVIIGAVQIGANCNISHGVTLGRSGRVDSYQRPRLGDRVWIGPGAVITGDVEVGEDAVVGANAVVTHKVPARSGAYGVPARVQHNTASFDLISYRGVEIDSARLISRRLAEQVQSPTPLPSQPTRGSHVKQTQATE